VAEVPVGLGPEGAAVDRRRRRAYVTCSRSNHVGVVDLDRSEVIDEVAVGEEPIDAVFDEGSGRVFVCELRSSAVTVIDTASGRVERSVAVPGYPSALATDTERRRLYCGCAAGAVEPVGSRSTPAGSERTAPTSCPTRLRSSTPTR
jgi:YVTN family beta-propeller protein